MVGWSPAPWLSCCSCHADRTNRPIDTDTNLYTNQQGGQAVVDAVLKGTHSFLYTETDMDIVVRIAYVYVYVCIYTVYLDIIYNVCIWSIPASKVDIF